MGHLVVHDAPEFVEGAVEAAHPEEWELKTDRTYYTDGAAEHEHDYLDFEDQKHGRKHYRFLTKQEADLLTERLATRNEHEYSCGCEVCTPHGATDHIKSFKVKPIPPFKN